MNEELVPDLYRLAFVPGCFRCPKCEFQWSISTLSVATGQIGTTEADSERLKQEFDERDKREAQIAALRGEIKQLRVGFTKEVRIVHSATNKAVSRPMNESESDSWSVTFPQHFSKQIRIVSEWVDEEAIPAKP